MAFLQHNFEEGSETEEEKKKTKKKEQNESKMGND